MRPRHHDCERCLMPLGKDTHSMCMYLLNKLPTRRPARLLGVLPSVGIVLGAL
jgi:hypothetical protein